MKIKLEDAVALKYCRRGCMEFCERHNMDWYAFRHGGIDVEDIAHIDDAMLHDVIEQARKREGAEQ